MGLDRRIVSILYHNGITDVDSIEEFIGEDIENYYEVKINGKVHKLEIPGYEYNKNVNIFSNNLEEIVDNIKNTEKFTITKTVINVPIMTKEDFSFEDELKKTEAENTEVLKSIKKDVKPKNTIKKDVKPNTKSTAKVVKKKTISDNDIDDFIDLA